jgi:hypothetical protein
MNSDEDLVEDRSAPTGRAFPIENAFPGLRPLRRTPSGAIFGGSLRGGSAAAELGGREKEPVLSTICVHVIALCPTTTGNLPAKNQTGPSFLHPTSSIRSRATRAQRFTAGRT